MALIVAFGGAAYAAIPSADGTINGCYAVTDGLFLGVPHAPDRQRVRDQPAARGRGFDASLVVTKVGAIG